MLVEGLRLMVLGMSTVFGFLGLLVVGMHANAAVARRLFPEPVVPPAPKGGGPHIAVVLAAIAAQRGGHTQ